MRLRRAFEWWFARPGSTPLGEAAEVVMDTLGTYWHSHPKTEERIRRVSHTIERSIP
jgi:Zn-dependent protease with chaperone function